MDFNQSNPSFDEAISLYPPDHITYLNNDSLLIDKTAPHRPIKAVITETSPFSSFPWTSPTYDLQEILTDYQSQPNLLQLILESKIQQDRRRTEEAQLRLKELDLILLQHHHRWTTARLPDKLPITNHLMTRKRQYSSLFGSNMNDSDGTLSLLQMSTNLPDHIDSAAPSSLKYPKSRKRREMQVITKLVETKDHDYMDGHFWRNNGNTIQKKTGNKSVYFKCANSIKGCPVNKTSTYNQLTGDYLIKYRGEHLPDCDQVQHIVEV